MNEWFTAKEVAGLPGLPVTKSGVIRKALSESWRTREVPAKGGPRREYHITALPEATRRHLFDIYHGQESGLVVASKPTLPVPDLCTLPVPDPCTLPAPQAARSADSSARARSADSCARAPGSLVPQIPEKARRIALARLDLLRLWADYRVTHAAPGKKTAVDPDFVQAYNTGIIFPAVFAILGAVSLQTLYRWKSELDDTDDWTRLAPAYQHGPSGLPRLSPEAEHVFLGLLLHGNKLKIGKAILHTQYYFERKGLLLPHSPMTFRRAAEDYRTRHYDRWVAMREGEKALTDKVIFSIRRDPSLLSVGECLVADGHRLNFQVVNPDTGKPCRATFVAFLDWKSWDLAGYEIMLEENTQCIASAYRNAILRLGKIPPVLYLDNGRAFRARFFTSVQSFDEEGVYGIFARMGTKPVFARPYNARAKVIERWFQEFSEGFERLTPSYTGASIEDKPARLMRNERWHKSLYKGYIPTIPEAIDMIAAWHEFHRSRPCPHVKGRTIGEVFDEGRGGGVDPSELDDLMMTAKAARIGPNGIKFMGEFYRDDALYGLREECSIRYSIFDLSFVLVYDRKGNFLCKAERPPLVHPIAARSDNPLDMETLKTEIAAQKALKRRTMGGVVYEVQAVRGIDTEWAQVPDKGDHPRASLHRGRPVTPRLPAPHEEHIPEEAVARTEESVLLARTEESVLLAVEKWGNGVSEACLTDRPERPNFYGLTADTDRYEWHLRNGFHTDQDMEFKHYFESTQDYHLIYVVIPRQQREYEEQQTAERSPASATN